MSNEASTAQVLTPAELAHEVEQLDDQDWYDFLDELDEVSRRRRQREPESPGPAGKSRDEVAAWVARKHIIADSGIREVWYLPTGAPPAEIRFQDVCDRLLEHTPAGHQFLKLIGSLFATAEVFL